MVSFLEFSLNFLERQVFVVGFFFSGGLKSPYLPLWLLTIRRNSSTKTFNHLLVLPSPVLQPNHYYSKKSKYQNTGAPKKYPNSHYITYNLHSCHPCAITDIWQTYWNISFDSKVSKATQLAEKKRRNCRLLFIHRSAKSTKSSSSATVDFGQLHTADAWPIPDSHILFGTRATRYDNNIIYIYIYAVCTLLFFSLLFIYHMFLIPVDADYTTIAAKRLYSMAFYFVVKTRTNIKFRNYCVNNVTEVGESRPLFFSIN